MQTRLSISVLCASFLLATMALMPTNTHAACNANALMPVQYGQQGAAVTTLQQCLIDAGYNIPAGATGYYGTQTQTAVKQFYAQTLNMPEWHGMNVGPQGRQALGAQAGTTATTPITSTPVTSAYTCSTLPLTSVTYGAQGAHVTTLQQCLIDAGYSIPAGATGYYGAQTRTAVQIFYADVLQIPNWHGNALGPVGRSALASRAQTPTHTPTQSTATGYRAVTSAEELTQYIEEDRSYGRFSAFTRTTMDADVVFAAPAAMESTTAQNDAASPDRVSTTNVQVSGIDEPDIVKTDGNNIFVSREARWYRGWAEPMIDIDMAVADEQMVAPNPQGTVVVDAYPLEDLAVVSEAIDEAGEMLLVSEDDMLLIFSHPSVVGYDIANPNKPKRVWEFSLEDNTSLLTARLMDGEVYLVVQTYLRSGSPCPMPLMEGTRTLSIACTDILVPERIEPVSHTYTLLTLDPTDGVAEKHVSIAGESGATIVSMFRDNLYLASRVHTAQYAVLIELMIESMENFLPAATIAHARTIQGYDISETGKLREIETLFENALARFDPDERMRIENEAANIFQSALQERVRDMQRTRIVRIPLSTKSVAATGEVPGYLLNQFALDEYESNVRVAVTVDDGWGGAESVNDVYVLDSNLDVLGEVQDLGLSERIYAARFMGDVGYLVTFRQIDPFYVLDLSVPTSPKMVGELKIPGYSAYLEALGNDLVLGVGRDGGNVKLSIFDTSNPAQPIEKSKYILKEGWTEVENNHHAFLRDPEHEIFFIPGSNGGYIFSYADGALTLKKTLSGYDVKRAVYIDDFLYVVSTTAVRVLDELTWEEVASLEM